MLHNLDSVVNVGVRNGIWGEKIARDVVRARGYEILDYNCRPFTYDRRLEIDIVAFDKSCDTLIFVEVKQHAKKSPYQNRVRSLNKRKVRNMRIVCNSWRRKNGWDGCYRFDVIEIYGRPDDERAPEIDYIENVNIFVSKKYAFNPS